MESPDYPGGRRRVGARCAPLGVPPASRWGDGLEEVGILSDDGGLERQIHAFLNREDAPAEKVAVKGLQVGHRHAEISGGACHRYCLLAGLCFVGGPSS